MRKARLVIVALLVLAALVVAVAEARPERETIWIQPGDTVILVCADEWGRSRPDYVKVAPFAGEVSCSEVVRPVAPTAAPGYLVHGMPAGSTARLECDGWLDVVEDDTSVIEVVCQPWVMAPGR